jgi:hypothetical protein
VPCDPADWEAVERRLLLELDDEEPDLVWVPLPEPSGHRHHNRLAGVALALWPGRVRFYSTYHMVDDWPVRSAHGERIEERDGWAELKRQALACYPSQSGRDGTAMHFEQPLAEYELASIRLNLGGGINPIPGFVNLDKSDGWQFEDGLEAYPDESVRAITISHTLMYVPIAVWPDVFAELARVLEPGGMVRITEDAIGAPGSNRPRLRPGAAIETNLELALAHLRDAGLEPAAVDPDDTHFVDESLIQANYGDPPDVFHVEAVNA